MKYLKKFESFEYKNESHGISDISSDIADDIISKLKDEKEKNNGVFTIKDYDKYMTDRGADDITKDSVMHYLVDKGFDFDSEYDQEVSPEELDFKLEKK